MENSKPAGYPAAKDIEAAVIVMSCVLIGALVMVLSIIFG